MNVYMNTHPQISKIFLKKYFYSFFKIAMTFFQYF